MSVSISWFDLASIENVRLITIVLWKCHLYSNFPMILRYFCEMYYRVNIFINCWRAWAHLILTMNSNRCFPFLKASWACSFVHAGSTSSWDREFGCNNLKLLLSSSNISPIHSIRSFIWKTKLLLMCISFFQLEKQMKRLGYSNRVKHLIRIMLKQRIDFGLLFWCLVGIL